MTEVKKSLKRTLIGKVVSDKRAKTVTVLVERREGRGLLGGMLGFPGDGWDGGGGGGEAPLQADWVEVGEVRHTFTHFHLVLRVMTASADGNPMRGMFMDEFRPDDLPTLMRKAYDLAAANPPR